MSNVQLQKGLKRHFPMDADTYRDIDGDGTFEEVRDMAPRAQDNTVPPHTRGDAADINGGVTLNRRDSPVGEGVHLDGVSRADLFLQNSIEFEDGEPYTLLSWVYYDPTNDTNYQFWVGNYGFGGQAYMLQNQGDDVVEYRDNNKNYYTFRDTYEHAYEWVPHAYVCDGTNIQYWENGEFVSEITPSSTFQLFETIGHAYSSGEHNMKGAVSDFRIYDRTLNAAEIRAWSNQRGKHVTRL